MGCIESSTLVLSPGDRESRDRHGPARGKLADYLQARGTGIGASVLPRRAEAREFYAAFVDGNGSIARRWFSRQRLFSEDFSRYPEEPEPLDREQVAGLLAGFATGGGEAAH